MVAVKCMWVMGQSASTHNHMTHRSIVYSAAVQMASRAYSLQLIEDVD